MVSGLPVTAAVDMSQGDHAIITWTDQAPSHKRLAAGIREQTAKLQEIDRAWDALIATGRSDPAARLVKARLIRDRVHSLLAIHAAMLELRAAVRKTYAEADRVHAEIQFKAKSASATSPLSPRQWDAVLDDMEDQLSETSFQLFDLGLSAMELEDELREMKGVVLKNFMALQSGKFTKI